jgi:carbon storage regulator
MLVLSRKPGEEIVVGDDILLTAVAIRGNQVRLGLTGPAEVSIRREELRAKGGGCGNGAVRPATSEGEP